MEVKQLRSFLLEHELVHIGRDFDNIISEVIVDDWKAFVDLVYSLKSKIIEISWWEKCLRSAGKETLGGGGPVDPKDARFFWAELPPSAFYYIVPEGRTKRHILTYVNAIVTKYSPKHILYPAFTIMVYK